MANVEILVSLIDKTKMGVKSLVDNLLGVGDSAEVAEKKIGILSGVVAATTALIVDSYGEYSKLAEEIRDLSLVSGESAESTSRFIQVLDDYQLTASDATSAAKKLKENGLSPTIETLAELSDQFRGIQDPAERMDFVYDKLGKSGSKFVNMLNQGSEALLANADAINKNLIMSDFEIKMYEVGRLAIDEKRDALAAFRVELGQNVGNVLAFAKAMERASQIQEESTIFVNGHKERTIEYAEALDMAIAEQLKAADSAAEYKYNLEEQAAALKEVSAANADLISSAIQITEENKRYQESQADIQAQIAELQAEKEGYAAWEVDSINKTQEKIDELIVKYDEDATAYIEAQNKKAAMQAIEKIALLDGVAGYSEAEYEKARAILETTDTATAAAFEQAQAQDLITTAVANGRISVEQFGEIMKTAGADGVIAMSEVQAAIDAIPDVTVKTVSIVTNYSTAGQEALTQQIQGEKDYTPNKPNAVGGSFTVPMSYGNEGFMMSNNITASGGETVTISKGDSSEKIIAALYATRLDESKVANMILEGILQDRR